MLLNCGVGEDSWESLGLQGDQTSQFLRKSVLNILWKDWCQNSILWPLNANSWLTGKDPDTGKDWGQEEKRATEDEMVGWHHQLDGHASAQTPGDREGQGSLSCCSPWGLKELHTAEWRTTTIKKKQSSTTVIKLGPSTIFLALLGTYDYLTFVVIAMVKDEG